MPDFDPMTAKAASLERCVLRARSEFAVAGSRFSVDFTRKDAAVPDIQRACETAIAMARHFVRTERLGVASPSGEAFPLLAQAGWIPDDHAQSLRRMSGFRNIAVHNYQVLMVRVVVDILENHLGDFERFAELVLRRTSSPA